MLAQGIEDTSRSSIQQVKIQGQEEGESGFASVHVSGEIKIIHEAVLWYVLKFKMDPP